jgi:hypothetical protein
MPQQVPVDFLSLYQDTEENEKMEAEQAQQEQMMQQQMMQQEQEQYGEPNNVNSGGY